MTVQKKILDLTGSQYLVQKVKSAINDVDSSLSTHIADTDIHVTTADKNKWNNQTYVFRYSSTALVASSTNSNALLDNTDNLKVGDKVIDSSGVLFSITAIDTANSTFTIGTALIDLAQDSDVVHNSGSETVDGFKQFANIRVTNSIKGINLDSTTTDLNNCYSDFAPYGEGKGGNIQYYCCNTDAGTANISNLPESKAFFLTSITTRLISNSLYVKQILISSTNKTYTRYCNNGTWGSWVNETDSEYVHKSGDEIVGGEKTFSNIISSNGSYLGNEASANERTNLYLLANRDTDGQSGAYIGRFRQNRAQGTMSGGDVSFVSFDFLENSTRYTRCFTMGLTDWDSNGVPQTYYITSPSYKGALGTAYQQWKSVYATNYYYGSNNVEFSNKFVTTDTAQTISETKTFTNTIKSQKEIEFTGHRLAYILPEFSAGYSGLSLCTYGSNGAVKIGSWKVDDNDNTKHVLNDSLGYLNVSTGAVNSVNIVYLTPRNASKAKLGDSVNKWHEINGVEPSSLSLPSGNASDAIDISSYFTSGVTNTYTASANGWIYLRLGDISSCQATVYDANNNRMWGQSASGSVEQLTIPILKGQTLTTQWATTSSVTVATARFIPCQGNV